MYLSHIISSSMLDQRRAKEKGYITLKEAAELANYTPDYVGQLIRAGKIKGKQVYSQVAWVTTPEEIRAYVQNKNRTVSSEHPLISTAKDISRLGVYTLIAFIAFSILLFQYVLFVSQDSVQAEAKASMQSQTVTMQTK